MEPKTNIISASWIATVDSIMAVLEDHALVIEDTRIIDICPLEQATNTYPNAELTECKNHLLIPGLINAHTHAAMSLFRGLADDLPLNTWLEQHIWPAETRCVNQEFIEDGTQLAIAEMLLSGTTLFNDMYFFPDAVASVSQDLGIKASVGLIVMDFPTVWASNPDEYFEKGLQVHDSARSLSLVSTAIAPHAPYTVSDQPLKTARTYADELQVPVHMHIHETKHEVQESIQQYGMRPLERLHALGLLNPRMMAVHMTQLTEEEISLCAEQGVHIVHCPESNQKLASGACPVTKLIEKGANVCLGTDSAASNNDLDMIGEMRSAAMQAKSTSNDASALTAKDVLRMATINGATALNLQDDVGSLEIGKAADIVAIDLGSVFTQPVYDPISQLVYSASRENVTDVWIDGKQVVKNRTLTTMDIEKTLDKAHSWQSQISQAANDKQ